MSVCTSAGQACSNPLETATYTLQQKDVRRTQNLQRAVKEILLAYAYPRLDVEVSKKMNHLLKAPFLRAP